MEVTRRRRERQAEEDRAPVRWMHDRANTGGEAPKDDTRER